MGSCKGRTQIQQSIIDTVINAFPRSSQFALQSVSVSGLKVSSLRLLWRAQQLFRTKCAHDFCLYIQHIYSENTENPIRLFYHLSFFSAFSHAR